MNNSVSSPSSIINLYKSLDGLNGYYTTLDTYYLISPTLNKNDCHLNMQLEQQLDSQLEQQLDSQLEQQLDSQYDNLNTLISILIIFVIIYLIYTKQNEIKLMFNQIVNNN